MSVSLSLNNKVALISGGSRGIGAATVRMFVAAGARVVFSFQKAQEPALQLVKELGKANCAAFAADLSQPENASKLVAAVVETFGRLDIVVAN
ncbi:MAG: SDR family NAD(P)-dependent oxidoreductase, partial [Terriglobales bacterium]